ncbi:MAG: hypothetical protein V1800_16610 [Candidatus Latescibacterota bacterium]
MRDLVDYRLARSIYRLMAVVFVVAGCVRGAERGEVWHKGVMGVSVVRNAISTEPLAKCSILAKVKEGGDFDRRNNGRILRIKI